MADILQEGYTQSVRCLICARPARRGATLCAQCKAAVRRARHTPNVKPEYLPHAPVVRTDARRSVERNHSHTRPARRTTRATVAPPLGGWGTYATIIAFGLAVCLTGYLAIGDNERAFYLSRTAAPPTASTDTPEDAAAKARPPMPSLAADPDPPYEAVADEHLAVLESLTPALRTNPDRKPARDGGSAKDANVAQGVTEARDVSTQVPLPAVAPLAVAAAPAALAEPVAPDRWAQLSSALSRCERENLIAGLVCKERARLQYCEGEWGTLPQCPAAVASLNTR
jgi:hypothetical protein